MNINSLLTQQNSVLSDSAMLVQSVKHNAQQALLDMISLSPNSVISGEIISAEGRNVVLNLGDGKLLNALLDGNVDPKVGQKLSFNVQGNPESGITLHPLFENTAAFDTANRALESASLPVSGRLQYMVKTMMDEGLPIDKQSLYEMNRAMNLNPETDVSVLSQMKRLNIPLTSDMVSQFTNYLNAENEILATITDVGDALINTFEFMSENGETGEFVNILKMFTDAFDEEITGLEKAENSQDNIAVNKDVVASEHNSKSESAETNTSNEHIGVTVEAENEAIVNKETLFKGPLTKQQISSMLLKIGIPEKMIENIDDDPEAIGKMLKTPEFRKSLDKFLTDQFRLLPEEVAKEDSVTKLYSKLNETVKNLTSQLEISGRSDTPVYNALNNVNSNLEFMNQLNQTFNYVQIPLKMSGQDATGELYVYSNKKSLAQSDGNVSALLHLDMDHLGPVDVHVSLSNQSNVRTKFFLKDDAALDLISENIGILNERLEKRGYSMNTEFINRSDTESVMQTILNDTKNISIVSSTSFDARA